MERILNLIKQQAGALDQGGGQPRFGTVASVNPAMATARVTLQPEGVLTGWLPILSLWTGSGWGMCCPPSPGDQVFVVAQEGDAEHGVIVGCAYSNTHMAPNAPVGELWLVHKSGSFIKLQNDGTIRIQGDLHVAGDVYDQQGALSRLRGHYDEHTHTDSRGAVTSGPNQRD
jgi:phage baseplate assembly protein gpV